MNTPPLPYIGDLISPESLSKISKNDTLFRELHSLSEKNERFWVAATHPTGCVVANEAGQVVLPVRDLRLGQQFTGIKKKGKKK